jgi:hypothetical protein
MSDRKDRRGRCALVVGVAAGLTCPPAPAAGPGVRVSEVRVDQPSADVDEYFELAGPPGASLDGLTYIVIGDLGAGDSGVVEAVIDVTGHALDAGGFFVAAEATFGLGVADLVGDLNFENGDNVTHMLVSGFKGNEGDDLDIDDDGVLDAWPWDEVVDCIALIDAPDAGDHVYCQRRVGPDGSGAPFHVYRCSPSFVWRVGDADPVGGDDTPGATNTSCPCLADLDATGDVGLPDLLELVALWGPCAGCEADFSSDGCINAPDLAFLLESWGPCPSAPVPGKSERFNRVVAVDATDQDAADEGFIVTRLYATGDGVGAGDRLLAVGFADISAASAVFFQEPIFGGDLPPDSFLFQFEPRLEYDTFVTINRLADDDNTTATPGLAMDDAGINGGWFAVPVDDQAEATDISGITGNPGQAGVLIAQITLIGCEAPPGEPPGRPGYTGAVTLYTSAADGGTLGGAETDVRFPSCRADLDGDGVVGIIEFLEVLAAWGACWCCGGDIDGDGVVGVLDFLAVLEAWGACP